MLALPHSYAMIEKIANLSVAGRPAAFCMAAYAAAGFARFPTSQLYGGQKAM